MYAKKHAHFARFHGKRSVLLSFHRSLHFVQMLKIKSYMPFIEYHATCPTIRKTTRVAHINAYMNLKWVRMDDYYHD